jgi:hypothetical protein
VPGCCHHAKDDPDDAGTPRSLLLGRALRSTTRAAGAITNGASWARSRRGYSPMPAKLTVPSYL